MLVHPDRDYATLSLERKLMLERAERRALLLEGAKRPRSTPAGVRVEMTTVRWGHLARAIRPLRWVGRAATAGFARAAVRT